MEVDVPARRLILIRHGHYEREGDLGDTVWGLSALGRRQAARCGRRLLRQIPNYNSKFEGIYTSPWPRALQTAEIIAHELQLDKVRIKPYLHELPPLVNANEKGLSVHPGMPITPPEDRKAAVAQLERIQARFFKSSRADTTYVIVCHGNLIRYLVASTLGLPLEAWMNMDICHASITEIRIFPQNLCALVSYNDTGHHPPQLVSS
jgi:broad specificity phosphatase PhoE